MTFTVYPFNHINVPHPVPFEVLTIPVTASWVPASSSTNNRDGSLVPETRHYKTLVPTESSALRSFGLVRSPTNHGKAYYVFYAVDDVTMWALPCSAKGVTWTRVTKRLMPSIPNQSQLDAMARLGALFWGDTVTTPFSKSVALGARYTHPTYRVIGNHCRE